MKTEQSLHTATPWKIDKLFSSPWQITANKARIIATIEISDDVDKSNAEFIVKAVNAHDDLIRIARGVVSKLEGTPFAIQAQSALNKAKGV